MASLVMTLIREVTMFLSITNLWYIIQCATVTQEENVTILNQPGVVGVWRWDDRIKYYPLSDFRNESAPSYYVRWPEDNGDYPFQYPCEDRNSRLMLSNFTYSMNQGRIQSLQYYDLGIVDSYQPYWRRPKTTCLRCSEIPRRSSLAGFPVIYCERGDLSMQYFVRAYKTIFQGIQFGVAMVAIEEVSFAVIGLLVPVYVINRAEGISMVARIVAGHVKNLNWGVTLVEWLHLMALAAAGYTLIEGFGHSDPHHWRVAAMNTLAYYYRVQTACALVSSFLRQCANSMKLIVDHAPGAAPLVMNHVAVAPSADKHREMLIGQVVVCAVMVEYLYLTDQDYLDFIFQVVFAVITLAVTVSMSIVISVGCKSLYFIVTLVWQKMKPRIAKPLWHKIKSGIVKPLWHHIKTRIASLMAHADPAAAAAGTSSSSSTTPQPQPGSSSTLPSP